MCTAEELALHEIINEAEGFANDGGVEADDGLQLPCHGAGDLDFDLMREVLFEDHDCLMLYDERLAPFVESDGIRTTVLHRLNRFERFRY